MHIARDRGPDRAEPCRTCSARPLGLYLPILSPQARRDISATRLGTRLAPAGTVIRGQGTESDVALNIMSGWAFASHSFPDGRRQITRFLLTGALIDTEPRGLPYSVESIEAITEVVLCVQSRAGLTKVRRSNPELEERYVWLIEREAVLDVERLSALGQLSAKERVAHLLLELAVRLRRAPLRNGDQLGLPLTQGMIGEATGLTAVHVNRMLRQLRGDGLLELSRGVLTILDADALAAATGFDPAIQSLFLDRPRA